MISPHTINSAAIWTKDTFQQVVLPGGGLRVKKIQNYTDLSTLATEESYIYGANDDGIGTKMFQDKNFYKNYEDFIEEVYKGGTGVTCIVDKVYWYRNYIGLVNHTSPNYSGSPVLYKKVVFIIAL